MPSMHLARVRHAACALGDSIFAICGAGEGQYLNSIEMLDLKNLVAGWKLFNFSESALPPRDSHYAAVVSENEIVIFGGHTSKGFSTDVVVYDCRA